MIPVAQLAARALALTCEVLRRDPRQPLMKTQTLRIAFGIACLLSSARAAPPSTKTGDLAAPRNSRHSAASPAHLRVEWDDVATNETGYRVWRREAGGAWYPVGTTGPDV